MDFKNIIPGFYLPLKVAVVLLLCLPACPSSGQTQPSPKADSVSRQSGLAILSKAYGDSVVLRWAPTDGVVWSASRHKGYSLYRINYRVDGGTDTVLLTPPVRPQSLEMLNKKAGSKNKYLAMAAQALYGKDFRVTEEQPTSFLDEIQQQSDAYNLRFFVAMQAADLSPEAADALGLRWVDKTVKKGLYYGYIVRSDTATLSGEVMPGITKVINMPLEKPFVPQGLEGISGDRQIELHWYRRQPGDFSYYYIERSDDGGKTYKRLTVEPYFSPYDPAMAKGDSLAAEAAALLENSQVFVDSVQQNYKDYYYRIAGIDAFGDVSPFTLPLKIHAVDKTPPAAVIIDSVVNVSQNRLLVKWKDAQKAPDLAGYFVAKGNDMAGPFEPLHKNLLSKETTYFLDTTSTGSEKTYYVVASLDTAGNYTYSIPRLGIITDTTPPGKPTGLTGLMDKTGVVGLQWDPNPEADVKGYKVYYSYNPDKDYIMLTNYPIAVNTFVDSLSPESLERVVYYKIAALDFHGNHSDYSDVLKINMPVVAPTSPVAKSIYMEDGRVHVEWIGSSSEYVSEYEIFRKVKGDPEWSPVGKKTRNMRNPDFAFTDSLTTAGKEYSYTAESVDMTGIRSEKAFPVNILNNQTNVLKVPENLKATYSDRENALKITWDYPDTPAGCFFILYKSEDNESPGRWASKDGHERSATDQAVQKGHTYRYRIEVRQQDGNLRSEKSREVRISIP